MTGTQNLLFRWCRAEADARGLAGLFRINLTASYISHSELQGPRALALGKWVDSIEQVLEADLLRRVVSPLDAPPQGETQLAAVLEVDGHARGVFLITFSRTAPVSYCILEDIVIDSTSRSRGWGAAYLKWITSECRTRGINRLFLESGKDNERAHAFFEHHGFEPVSIVMMKDLKS